MKHHEPISDQDTRPDEAVVEASSSVDDFIRELEAKEKALHITSDMTIEIADSEFDSMDLADIDMSDPEPLPRRPAVETVFAAQVVGSKTRIYELELEVRKLNERVVELRSERNDIQEKSDQRLKDFQNFKYRMDRERRGSFIDQISNLATQMLPVLDNLDRALDSVSKIDRKKSDDFQQFFDGIVLVNNQVNEVFGEMGVEPIKTVGQLFDPNFHEAVAVEDRDDTPANTIVEEMLRGYRIGNRVIRHSMVKVTSSPNPIKTDAVDLNPPDAPLIEDVDKNESKDEMQQPDDK